MKKALIGIFTVLSAFGLICQAVWAGGVDNKQNFSTRYLEQAAGMQRLMALISQLIIQPA